MASSSITSWQTEGKKVEVVTDFLFLGSKITADIYCSHEIRRWSLLGRKAMTNPGNVLKSRDITMPTKVCIVKPMVFPVVTNGSESWTLKKAECQRIDTFKLWCWRTLLRAPWTARRSNQSIFREINPDYSLEGLMLKLKRQYFGHRMRTDHSLEKSWCWKDWGQKEKKAPEDEMAGWHHRGYGHEFGQTPRDGEGQGGLACCNPWCQKEWEMIGQLNNSNTAYIQMKLFTKQK